MSKRPLEFDMVAGSQLRDTQGEMLSVEGADISELEAGRGRANDNHGKGFFNSIGRITHAKKIFKAEDCDDDRQKYYWNKIKAPYIYAKGVMFDDEDHPNAKAAAAILRNIHKIDAPLKLKASVEGGVLSRGISDPSLLARTKIHSVALTFTPANTATLVEPLNLDKAAYDEAADMALIQSVMHLAQTSVPSFRHIERDAVASKIAANFEKIANLVGDDGTIVIPTKQEIIQYALEKKVRANVEMIQDTVNELISEIVEEEPLDKGFKQAMATALTAGALAMPMSDASSKVPHSAEPHKAPQSARPPKEIHPETLGMKATPMHAQVYKELSAQNPYLAAIGRVESGGGTNIDHKTVWGQGSDHGHTAGGIFGLMPNEMASMLRRDHKLRAKYPELAKEAENRYDDESVVNHRKFTNAISQDPHVDRDFAQSAWNFRKKKFKDLGHGFYSWKMGLHGAQTADPTEVTGHPYVKQVMKEFNDEMRQRHEKAKAAKKHKASRPMKKALMAGYGGAAAPTTRVSGGVVQSESIDSSRQRLKYVTCDDCGKEQVHSKYQVKCRECGKGFSLKKLHKVLCG